MDATTIQNQTLNLLPAPSLRQLHTTTPNREASDEPEDAEDKTKEVFSETGRRIKSVP
jgi:hypothetical protein